MVQSRPHPRTEPGVNMKKLWNAFRGTRIVLPSQRTLHYRSTQSLLARRKRLQQCLSIGLVAFVGLGSLIVSAG